MMRAPRPQAIDTDLFRTQTRLSRVIRGGLGLIVPQFFPDDRAAAYRAQFAEASRNAEIAIEAVLRIFATRPRHAPALARVIYDWRTRYPAAQKAAEHADRYFVYTDRDARIPFVPEEDTHYAYMLPQVAYIASELTRILSPREFENVAATFVAMNDLGVETFHACPTVMPRYTEHERLTLHAVQADDEPLNCCPSLHIAYSVMLDNLGSVYLRGRDSEEALKAVRYSTLRMINSVLYTKQHALIDVSFGILCAEFVFRERFGTAFDMRRAELLRMKKDHPIDYDMIVDTYDDVRSRAERNRIHRIAPLVRGYLEENRYPRIGPTDNLTRYCFDLVTRELIAIE